MAKKSMILKQQAPAKFSTRKYNRCKLCGRPHAYLRDYGVHKVRRRLAASSNEKIQDFSAILRWPGSAYTKYAIALPPRLAKNLSSVSAIPGRSDTASPGLTKNNSFQRGPRPLVYRMAKGHW